MQFINPFSKSGFNPAIHQTCNLAFQPSQDSAGFSSCLIAITKESLNTYGFSKVAVNGIQCRHLALLHRAMLYFIGFYFVSDLYQPVILKGIIEKPAEI